MSNPPDVNDSFETSFTTEMPLYLKAVATPDVIPQPLKEIAEFCVNFISNYRGTCKDEFNAHCKEQWHEGTGEGFSDEIPNLTLVGIGVTGLVIGIGGTLIVQKIIKVCRGRSTENVEDP